MLLAFYFKDNKVGIIRTFDPFGPRFDFSHTLSMIITIRSANPQCQSQ